MNDNKPVTKRAKRLVCPLCKKPRDQAYRPFCSRRCRDIDLNKWLDGAYAVPAVESGEDSEFQD